MVGKMWIVVRRSRVVGFRILAGADRELLRLVLCHQRHPVVVVSSRGERWVQGQLVRRDCMPLECS